MGLIVALPSRTPRQLGGVDRDTAIGEASTVAIAADVVCGTSDDVPPEGQALEANVGECPGTHCLYHHRIRACGTGYAHRFGACASDARQLYEFIGILQHVFN